MEEERAEGEPRGDLREGGLRRSSSLSGLISFNCNYMQSSARDKYRRQEVRPQWIPGISPTQARAVDAQEPARTITVSARRGVKREIRPTTDAPRTPAPLATFCDLRFFGQDGY